MSVCLYSVCYRKQTHMARDYEMHFKETCRASRGRKIKGGKRREGGVKKSKQASNKQWTLKMLCSLTFPIDRQTGGQTDRLMMTVYAALDFSQTSCGTLREWAIVSQEIRETKPNCNLALILYRKKRKREQKSQKEWVGEREIEKTSLLFDIPMNIYLTVFRFYLSLSR